MSFEITDRNEWYLQTAVKAGMNARLESINECARLRASEEGKSLPSWAGDSLKSGALYNLQCLGETFEMIGEVLPERDREEMRELIVIAGEQFDFVPRGVRVQS